ncbi:MAG: hypothetical protein ABFD04_00905 [Syntrophomonas sp.]
MLNKGNRYDDEFRADARRLVREGGRGKDEVSLLGGIGIGTFFGDD